MAVRPASSGKTLVVAQLNALQTGITAAADITNLSITFIATSRPIWVCCYIPTIKVSTTGGTALIYVTDPSNNFVAYTIHDVLAAGQVGPVAVMRRFAVGDLTAGTSYTFKARGQVTGGGTLQITAGVASIPTSNGGPAYLYAYEEN
jgi:outer membrane protein assembly factor BamB